MNKHMKAILVCPKCKNKLDYIPDLKEMVCKNDQLSFPLRNGVPVLLESEAKFTGNVFDKAAPTQQQMSTVELIE